MEAKLASESRSQLVRWMGALDANGDLVRLSASANAAWRTSMEVGVRVEAEDPLTGEARHTAYLTMVALRRSHRLAERDGILSHRRGERVP